LPRLPLFPPKGRYLEIFARKNNLRNYWVSVGNEVTGTGLPETDLRAFEAGEKLPGAVFGARKHAGGGGGLPPAGAAGAAGAVGVVCAGDAGDGGGGGE
jgi:hypothetical protein